MKIACRKCVYRSNCYGLFRADIFYNACINNDFKLYKPEEKIKPVYWLRGRVCHWLGWHWWSTHALDRRCLVCGIKKKYLHTHKRIVGKVSKIKEESK